MIFDHLSNKRLYTSVTPLLKQAFDFLDTDLPATLPLGKHAIVGDDVFAIVQEYQTRLDVDVPWEAHRKYLDIQLLRSGIERMAYAHLPTLTVTKPYDDAKDVLLLSGPGTGDVIVTPGMFAIFSPEDAHRPTIAAGAPSHVVKVVVKVRVD